MAHLVSLVITIDFSPKDKALTQKPLTVKLQRVPFKKQIVQSEDSDTSEVKENAFLSDKNRSFERETKARINDTFSQGRSGGSFEKKTNKGVKLSDLSLGAEDPFKVAAQEYSEKKKGVGNSDPVRKVSSTNDHLEEIPEGDFTNLNTVEYKYYGFYHRIRQKLEQFWGRSIQEKAQELAAGGRQVALDEEHITALRIILDDQGNILDIHVLGSSGVKELDDAAIDSFNEAGPFPNPPRDLVVDGRVTIEWGFVVKS